MEVQINSTLQPEDEESKEHFDKLLADDEDDDPTGLLKIISNNSNRDNKLEVKWTNYVPMHKDLQKNARPNMQILATIDAQTQMNADVKEQIRQHLN